MKPEIKVNKKFLLFFVSFQIILVGLVLFAFLAPKTVTVHVENTPPFTLKSPLTMDPAFVDLQ